VILELTWNTGRLVREYTLLIDPPTTRAQAPSPSVPPVITAAPAPARPRTPEASAEARPVAPPPLAIRTPETRPAASKPAPAMAAEPRKTSVTPAAPAADSYRVKRGDTLYRIAGQTQAQGVSLDQMLVALFRANPVAFIENNMNRLKAGAVLAVPDADTARAASPAEALQLIQAQSADFAAYRQRLAGAALPADGAGSPRQASGKVQAAVDDRKQVSTPAPDKLTLSAGSASLKASAPEERASKEREAKDAATRAAELKKNVDELQQLAAATKPAASAGAAPSLAAAAASDAVPPAAVAAALPAAAAPEVAASAAPEAAGVSVPAAPMVSAAASRPAAPPASTATEEPGLIGTLLEDPLARAGGGLIVALLAGFGIYSYFRRSRKDSGETSFLESRLQPDSFFGVSGGQRIDTRDAAAGAPSSVSYSMSQLDAIGDVDPVAEADVYLAYGRDLQAEEILKEAMRGNPDRLAIRGKLLEVYAKRRDAKGFELLAQQMFTLTRGEGEDWAKAQELGAQIDPDNPLYRPGGQPKLPLDGDEQPVEPLSASTIAQSVLPSPSRFGEIAMATAVTAPPEGSDVDIDLDLSVDLDLDLGLPPANSMASPEMPEATQPMPAPASSAAMDLDLSPEVFEPSAAEPRPDHSLDFDLASISLDLDAAPPSAPVRGEGDSEALELSEAAGEGSDPFERKLELAEEFRQIGDTDGARDLLQEVIAQTTGAVQAKARNMLDRMG
jgi:pilus assembly protein FimV